jgi:hypothetical protein
MANMTVNQRNQFERATLSAPTGVAVSNPRRLAVFSAMAVVVLGALTYAAIERIDGWAQAVVLGFIFLTAIGAMIALSPNRRA